MPYDYLIPTVLFLIVLLGCLYHIGRYLPRGLTVLVIICVALIPKYSALTSPYYGTEYEDAFVFQADSKSLAEHSSEADPFRIQIAEYNFDKKKNELVSYTGHFTSFSGLVWLGNKTFGYSRFRAIELNILFSVLLFLMLYLAVYSGSGSKSCALISVLIFASSPVINLFQTSGLAETYSSLMIAIFLYFFIRFWKNQEIAHPDTLFLVLSLLMCLLIKRENMVLLSVLPFIGYKLIAQKNIWSISLLGVALCLYFIFVKPFSTELLEAEAISAPTFSINYLLVQLPTYIAAFFKPELHGIAFWVLSVLIIVLIHSRSLPKLESFVVIGVFLGYLAIYSLHYRSRFFVLSMEIGDFETFRYANNFFFLVPLFIGLSLKPVWAGLNSKFKLKNLIVVFTALFCISIYFSQTTRINFQMEEFQTRTLPLLTAGKLLLDMGGDTDAVLVTDIPVVGKMLETSEFDAAVQEFQAARDYSQYKDTVPLYFLVPRELANKHFDQKNLVKVIPLNIDTRYIFFRLL